MVLRQKYEICILERKICGPEYLGKRSYVDVRLGSDPLETSIISRPIKLRLPEPTWYVNRKKCRTFIIRYFFFYVIFPFSYIRGYDD